MFCPLVADSGFNGAFLCLFFLCRRTFLFSVGHSEQTNLRWRRCLRNLLCAGFISPIRYGNFGLGLLFLIGMLWSKQGLLILVSFYPTDVICSYRVWRASGLVFACNRLSHARKYSEQERLKEPRSFWRGGLKAELWLRTVAVGYGWLQQWKRRTDRQDNGRRICVRYQCFALDIFRMQPEAGMTDRETRKK